MTNREDFLCEIAEKCNLITGKDIYGKEYKDIPMIEFNKVSEITRKQEREFLEKCMDVAMENWCDSQVKMLQKLFECVFVECEYKCVNCKFFGKKVDAPAMSKEECMWKPSEENGWEIPCKEEE